MRNITSPSVDCLLALVCCVFCLLYGAFLLLQTMNKPFGFVVVFVGVANLIKARRMHKKIKKEKI